MRSKPFLHHRTVSSAVALLVLGGTIAGVTSAAFAEWKLPFGKRKPEAKSASKVQPVAAWQPSDAANKPKPVPAAVDVETEEPMTRVVSVPPMPQSATSSTTPQPMTADKLSLAALEELAIANNPTVQQAAALVEKAGGQFDQAGLYPNPVVGYQASEVGNEGRAGQQGVFISQEFVRGGKLGLSQEVANQDIQRLQWQYSAQSQRVRNEVRLRFYELLGAQAEQDIAQQLEDVARKGVEIAQKLVKDAQTASKADVLQAEIDFNQVRIAKQNADRRVVAAKRRLALVTGNPQLSLQTLDGQLAGEFEERGFESEWPKLTSSPQLQAAAWRISRAQALIRREQVQPIPNVEVQLGTQYDAASRYQISNIQVGVPLPVFNRNQGNIRSAMAEMRAAQEEQRRLELTLQDQLAEAVKRYETSRFQVERFDQDIIPKAAENLRITNEGYERFGQFDFLRVLIARRSYFETNLAYIRSLTELRQAEVALDGLLLTGGLEAAAE